MLRGARATWVDRLMFGLLIFFVIATLGQALIGRVTLLDVNLLTRFQPWASLHGTNIDTTNICRGDTVDSVMPGLAEIRRRLFALDYPGWTPYTAGGAPLGGGPNVGQFSPLSLPYFVLPLWLAPAFVKLLQFAVGILGLVLFTRRLGLRTASGVLGGLAFITSSYMVSWTNWPQTQVGALIPLLFWATERLVQQRRLIDAMPLAAVVAAMLLGGFPSVTGMALYAAALYFLVRIVVLYRTELTRGVQAISSAVVGLVLGVGLTAFQLLPFLRQLQSVNLDYRAQGPRDHSRLSTLVTSVAPDAQGLCIGGRSSAPKSPIEDVAYLGVMVLVLAVVAVLLPRVARSTGRSRGVIVFMLTATAFFVLVGWFGGPALAVLHKLPVFSNNQINRIRAVLGLTVAVLAAFGFDRILDRLTEAGPIWPDRRRRLLAAGWAAVVVAVLVWLGVKTLHAAQRNPGRYTTAILTHALSGTRVLLIVAVLVGLAAVWGPRWLRYVAATLAAALVVGSGVSYFKSDVTGSEPRNFYPVTSTHTFLADNLGSDRYETAGARMYTATAGYYGLRTATGHQFTQYGWRKLLEQVDPLVMQSATYSSFSDKALSASNAGKLPVLDQLGVRYFVANDFDVPGQLVPVPAGTTRSVIIGADQPVNCAVPAGRIRAVVVEVTSPLTGGPHAGAEVRVRVHTPNGDITGARSLGVGLAVPTRIAVAVPGEDLTTTAGLTADVSVHGMVGSTSLASDGVRLSCGVIDGADDGLKLVHSDAGATVYQRLTSLPRIRWAGSAIVQTDRATQLASINSGLPADTVSLNQAGPTADGRAGQVRIEHDNGDAISAQVQANGAGYLVVADSLQQPGWSATVDGRRAELRPADSGLVAIAVPAGTHQVRLNYTVPALRSGSLISVISLGLVAIIVALSSGGRRRIERIRRARRDRRDDHAGKAESDRRPAAVISNSS